MPGHIRLESTTWMILENESVQNAQFLFLNILVIKVVLSLRRAISIKVSIEENPKGYSI